MNLKERIKNNVGVGKEEGMPKKIASKIIEQV